MNRSFRAGLLAALWLAIPAATRTDVTSASSARRTDRAASSAAACDAHKGARRAFRLGDASRPFGWSTAVGDLNTDGRPDVAVADHVARHAGSYAYRIELSISGEATRDLTFESTHEAVTLTLSDVDRDHHLDLVVGAPLSGETVAVWLNDGHGHFTFSPVRELPARIAPVDGLRPASPDARAAGVEPSSPRRDKAPPARREAAPSTSGSEALVTSERPASSARRPSRLRSRAPPPPSIASLS